MNRIGAGILVVVFWFCRRVVFTRAFLLLFVAAHLYLGCAWLAFQWRNPTSNSMSILRNFGDVVTWKKLPMYQPRAYGDGPGTEN